MFITASVAR